MRSLLHSQTVFLRFVVAVKYIVVARAQCYYPGGAWASDQFPCDKYAYTTLCCPTGWTCFSNNLCIATDPSVVSSDLPLGTAIRGTCTNPTWNDTVCGDFCLNDPVSSNNGSVIPCGNNSWCCQPDIERGMCDCSSGAGTFQVSDGTAQTIIGVVGLDYTSTGSAIPSSAAQSTSLADIVSTFSTISTSTLSTVSIISMTASSSVVSSSISMKSSLLPTSSSVVPSSTTNKPAPTKPADPVSSASATGQQIFSTSTSAISTTAFKAGIGAAAGIICAVLICLAIWCFTVRRRQQRQTREASFGDTTGMASRWEDPLANDMAFPMSPNPNPYEDLGYTAAGNQSVSRTALAQQVAHNRTIPRPRRVFGEGGEEGNPYADMHPVDGTGR